MCLCAAGGLGLSGCSTSRLAVGAMVPIIEDATEAAFRQDDPVFVRDAVPANLLLLEGLIRTDPRDELLVMATQFYFSYGFAFVEDDAPERAVELYAKGRAHGLHALGRHREVARALDAADAGALRAAVARLGRDEVPALFWTAAAWGAWINLRLESPAAIADLALVEVLLDRVLELDDTFEYGMPHLLMGAFYAARPRLLGGDPERGRLHFARAAEIADGKLLLAPLFEARYYATQTLDEELFEQLLTGVIEAPEGLLPEVALLNAVAQAKARRLLDAREDYF